MGRFEFWSGVLTICASILAAGILAACGVSSTKAGGAITVQTVQGPGVTCYAIIQDDTVRGGNCQ